MELDFMVGKYTLESLTNGMYASPFDLYREYIQNAVDSFDETIKEGLCDQNDLKIEICLDTNKKAISIKDNGIGIRSEKAVKTLLDIGNSQKHRQVSRGFRGIGRLSGLGYCDTLTFITSALNENNKVKIKFDAKKLKRLLLMGNETEMSIKSVINEIVTIEFSPEKISSHYFEVILEGVDMADKLIDREQVKDYLVQHCPLPFNNDFNWGSLINEKIKNIGYHIDCYRVILNVDGEKQDLYKPYQNTFVADRVKKIFDTIQDVEIVPLCKDEKMAAILWYANTNYMGTIMDNQIKGIRIRQGNILVGGKSTCNHFFKEERFNGWLIGEIYIIDPELIINSRRDDFEKNNAYYSFVDLIEEWASNITKDIRKKSSERSLSKDKLSILDNEDINGLNTETLEMMEEMSESVLMDIDESSSVADESFFGTIAKLLHMQKTLTKYSALNINDKLTIQQKTILERVFDIISQEYNKEDAEKFISLIAKKY